MYVDEVQSGQCSGTASPTIIKETPATAFVNGNNGIGMVGVDLHCNIVFIIKVPVTHKACGAVLYGSSYCQGQKCGCGLGYMHR